MRFVTVPLALLLSAFIAVQYNDPDGVLWVAFYGVPLAWAILGTVRPELLSTRWVGNGLLLCIGVALVGTFHYWPSTPHWWARDVWYEVETAREGMGMMIVVIALSLLWAVGALTRRRAGATAS